MYMWVYIIKQSCPYNAAWKTEDPLVDSKD